jgi:uncharacterized membrane protein YphA (DoxX/SURF4 family)
VSRLALAVFLVTFGLLKLGAGYSQSFNVPAALYYAIASAEVALAIALTADRQTIPAAWVSVALFSLGALWVYRYGPGCGCAGGVVGIGLREHMMLCGIGGILASCVVQSSDGERVT